MDELWDLIESIASGELAFVDQGITFKRPNTSPQVPSFYMRKRERDVSLAEFGVDSATYVLAAGEALSGLLYDEQFRTVDDALRASGTTWDGLADLRRNFMGIPEDQAPRLDWASAEIVAPVGVRLSRTCSLDDKRLEVVVNTFPKVDFAKVVVGVVAHLPTGSISRVQVKFDRGAESSERGPWLLRAVVELDELPMTVALLLTYRGVGADRRELRGKALPASNPRLAILESAGGGIDGLAEGLERARSRGREIEGWIALVFSLLDFVTSHYGLTPWEVPDVLAFASSMDWLPVIECTEREPDLGGKLTKLATRTKEIEKATGTRAYPVLVTALDRSVLNKTDLEKASKEAVAILSADEFSDLLRLVRTGATANETRSFLERLIPRGVEWSVYWRS